MVTMKLDFRKIPEGESRKTFVLNPSQLECPKDEANFQGGIQGDLNLNRRGGEIHIQGYLAFRTSLTCSRCLLPFEKNYREEVFLRYIKGHANRKKQTSGEVEIREEDLTTNLIEGEEIEIGEALRDIILLSFPVKPLCRDDCKGLCSRCGQDLNLGDCGCLEEEGFSGWKGLKKLT